MRALDEKRRCPVCSAPAQSSSGSAYDSSTSTCNADRHDDVIIKNYYSDIVPLIDKLASALMTPVTNGSGSSTEITAASDKTDDPDRPDPIEPPAGAKEETSSMSSLALTNQSVMALLQLKERQRKKQSSSSSIAVHRPGDAVTVLPRLWPGINKPGGPAHVIRVNGFVDGSGQDCTYDVKYILTSSEDASVPAAFLTAVESLDRKTRKRRGEEGDREENCGYVVTKATKTMKPSGRSKAITVSKFHPLYKTASPPKVVILSTLISDADSKQLARFTKLFCNSIVVTDFDNASGAVTHLVVGTGGKGAVQSRTMKFLKAIMRGIWVVDSRWVGDCCGAALILNEEEYEIKKIAKGGGSFSCRRARVAIASPIINFADCIAAAAAPVCDSAAGSRDDLLFSGRVFSLHGGFYHPGPARSDIEQLLIAGGGTVLASPGPEQATSRYSSYIALCSDAESRASLIDNLGGGEAKATKSSSSPLSAPVVNPLWLFDCVGSYTFITDFKNEKYTTFERKR